MKPTRSTIYARAANEYEWKMRHTVEFGPNAKCIDSFHWIKLRGATEEGEKAGLSRGRASCGRRWRLSDNFPNAIMDREMDGRTDGQRVRMGEGRGDRTGDGDGIDGRGRSRDRP